MRGEPDTPTIGALDRCRLMDELYRIFPPASEQASWAIGQGCRAGD